MKTRGFLALAALVMMAAMLPLPCAAAKGIWVKGNTHCHSTRSDGDVSPTEVAQWYKDHGYNFLFITDHEKRSDPAELASVRDSKFILIAGEEVTTSYEKIELHCNALGIPAVLSKPTGSSPLDALSKTLREITDAGGIAQINHPGFHFMDNTLLTKACTGPDAPKGPFLIEVYNHYGGADKAAFVVAAFESAWDTALSDGAKLYGVAADDAHKYKDFKAKVGNPGGGWIWVNVDKLTVQNVLSSIRQGKFYASTGVELTENAFNGKTVRVIVKAKPGVKYTMSFVGKSGFLLKESQGPNAEYKLTGREAYVRVRIDASDGTYAWTQPVRPKSK